MTDNNPHSLSINVNETYLPSNEQVDEYLHNLDYVRPTNGDIIYYHKQRDDLSYLNDQFDIIYNRKQELEMMKHYLVQIKQLSKNQIDQLLKNLDAKEVQMTRCNTLQTSYSNKAYSKTLNSNFNRSQSEGIANQLSLNSYKEFPKLSATQAKSKINSLFSSGFSKIHQKNSSQLPSNKWRCRRCTLILPLHQIQCECGYKRS